MLPAQQLTQQIAALPLNDEPQFCHFIALAARLAALGDFTQIERAPVLAKILNINLEHALVAHCRQGVVALSGKSGVDQVAAIIDAQDFFCLMETSAIEIPENARLSLQGLIEEASDATIDGIALEALQEFAAAYPLPDAFRLPAVFNPITDIELTLLAASAEPRKTIELSWGRVKRTVPELAHAIAFVSKPTDSLKEYFKRSHVEIDVPGEGMHRLSRRLEEDWRVVFSIEQNDGRPAEIESVRLGVLPSQRLNPTRWMVEISPFGKSACLAALDQALVIRFESGTRLKML